MLIIVMTVLRPKTLCRWCYSSKDTDEQEDEVVYGEVRYPDEVHSKYTYGTHMTNPLHHNCTEAEGSNKDSTFTEVNTIQSLLTCENTLVSHIPPHIEGDDDSSIVIMMSESTQIMNKNISCNLERGPVTKSHHLNDGEASHTPDVPPYYGFDTMTRNESHHSGRAFATENSNLELVEDSKKEAKPTPDVPSHHEIYMTMTRNTTLCSKSIQDENYPQSMPTSKKQANCTPSDHDTYITMTPNPSYHLKKNFFIGDDDVDCDKLMPTCIRKANLTLNIPMCSSDDDDDDDDDKVVMTRNPSYNLGINFATEGNFKEVSGSSTVSPDNDSCITMTAYRSGTNITKNNDANCDETVLMHEKGADHIPDVPPRNINHVTMTQRSNYSFNENLSYHSRRNITQDEVSTCKRQANHTLVAPPVHHGSNDGIAMMPNPSYNVKKNFFTETSSQQPFTCKRETGCIPDASECHNFDNTNDGMIPNAACHLKGNRFEEASSFSSSQLVVSCELEADSNPVIPQYT